MPLRRPRRRLLVGGALVVLVSTSDPAAPEPREVAVSRSGAIETSIARLPGRLLATAVARSAAGHYGLAVLVADDGGHPDPQAPAGDPDEGPAPGLPRSVFFVEPGNPALERVANGLPEKVNALAALVLPGNRADQLILGEPGVLYALDPPWGAGSGGYRKILAAPGIDLRALRGKSAGEPRPRLPWVPAASAGMLELLAGDASAPSLRALRAVASFPLPLAATRETWGIKLTSLPVRLLPAPPTASQAVAPAAETPLASGPRFAVGPETQGKERLRTLLLSTNSGEAPIEAWSLLPGTAQELDSSYATWEGRPVLMVSSVAKIGIFVKRDLRLFLLARDRSRGGSPPVLAVHTDCHLWQEISTYFAVLSGNGRQDLVLIYPEGLSGKKLRFQVWANLGQGRLAAQPRASTVDVEADDWFYGADFSGDGVPDLMVKSKGRLLLYPGVAKAYRVADRPTWSFNLPVPAPPPKNAAKHATQDDDDGDDRPARPASAPGARLADLVDLRGDGHATLFLHIVDDQGRSQIIAARRAL